MSEDPPGLVTDILPPWEAKGRDGPVWSVVLYYGEDECAMVLPCRGEDEARSFVRIFTRLFNYCEITLKLRPGVK